MLGSSLRGYGKVRKGPKSLLRPVPYGYHRQMIRAILALPLMTFAWLFLKLGQACLDVGQLVEGHPLQF